MTITLYRRGDFFECDGEDAVIMARELGLTLAKRDGKPMCGIPYHRFHQTVRDLGNAGYTVDAIIPAQRGIEQGAVVAPAPSAPEKPAAAKAVVEAHKPEAALREGFQKTPSEPANTGGLR